MSEYGGMWSPYLVGFLIGLLVMGTIYFSNKPLGVSTSFARIAGLIGNIFSKQYTESLKFYQDKKPKIDWEVMLMFGTIIGAFIAAYTGGEITGRWLPPMWEERFGSGLELRVFAAFIGGAIMAYGARLAGGCTSGHGISGTLQLSVGSWIALIFFFIGGAITAFMMFGGQFS